MATPRTTGAGTAILLLMCRLLVLAAIAAYLADTMFTHFTWPTGLSVTLCTLAGS